MFPERAVGGRAIRNIGANPTAWTGPGPFMLFSHLWTPCRSRALPLPSSPLRRPPIVETFAVLARKTARFAYTSTLRGPATEEIDCAAAGSDGTEAIDELQTC